MEDLKKLADDLSNLTVLECYQLAKIMKEEYGIESNTKIVGVNVSPVPTKVVEIEKTSFDVILKSAGTTNKLGVIKSIKEMTGQSLLEIKNLVDNAPAKLKENVSKDEAMSLLNILKELGAEIEVLCK
jgi:large subunit ribosomal protein L7/L12